MTAAAPTARVGLFIEPGFPSPDVESPDAQALLRSLDGLQATTLRADTLAAWLEQARPSDILVLPYGSAFPLDSWPAILGFLQRGGNWVNVGGVPFATPVVRAGGRWSATNRSTAYFKILGLTHAFEVGTSEIVTWQPGDPAAPSSPFAGGFTASVVFPLDVRLSNVKDFADEDGSTGPREGRLAPLLVGATAAGTRTAAPFVRLDRLQGTFAGGAWLLAPLRGRVAPAAVRALIEQAALGAVDFIARPAFAGFRPGESPAIDLSLHRPSSARPANTGTTACRVEVLEASGAPVVSGLVALAGDGDWQTGRFDVAPKALLARGLYKVRATLELAPGLNGAPQKVRSTTGFWMYDAAMLEGGVPLGTQADLFTRGGQPFPVVGTTYMASDVHRKFLLEPNPYLWDRDFGAMRAAGINLVRTGIWTGWKIYMPEVGALNERFLRALDVFLLTARKHDIPVVFTFFAFLPETWGGSNPYLDPRSVGAQSAFAGLIAQRYAKANDIAWDLINEPSFSSAKYLWQTRPNYDAYEAQAWQHWLTGTRHAGDRDEALRAWDAPPGDSLSLPPVEWFADRHLFGVSHPRAILDYRLFAQDAFTGWTRALTAAIRANGHRGQLVTVGQDEGGLTERPGPLFFGGAVDFTCMHTWWNNDDQAWDSVLSKRPGQPLLVEETGLMRYERMDGSSWRDEREAAYLLERKVAIAFGSGSAGVVQWIWNTNPYMPSDNEAGIGFFRADGTARPELGVFADIARFAQANAARFSARRQEDVVLLVPQSHVLSVRDLGTAATRRAVRALYYHLQIPVRAVGEHQVNDTLGTPRLVIAPSPAVLTDAAWRALLGVAERGATVLVTGPFDRDEYWRPTERVKSVGLESVTAPVAGTEPLTVGDQVLRAAYRGEKLERVEKAVVAGVPSASLHSVRRGEGTILWCPLPVELAEAMEPTIAVYRAAAAQAGIAAPVVVSPPDPGVFVGASRFGDTLLVALASETSADRRLDVRPAGAASSLSVTLPAQRALLLLVDARTGAMISRTEPR